MVLGLKVFKGMVDVIMYYATVLFFLFILIT